MHISINLGKNTKRPHLYLIYDDVPFDHGVVFHTYVWNNVKQYEKYNNIIVVDSVQ